MTSVYTTSLSDNQTYPQVCIDASNNYKLFVNFRQHPIYNEILEHASKEQGYNYLSMIVENLNIMGLISNFKKNDDYGNPKMHEYPHLGKISPTTLRYIKALADLLKHFASLENMSICEIGVGYGGQCRIIDTYFKPSTYCLVDIQPALLLTQRYLDHYIMNSILTYTTMNELEQKQYDLFLSNYAFTELPRSIQDVYLTKAILKSKRGYITYNEITPPEFNSYKSNELIEIIPGSKILDEEPLTHKNNCIIIWGENS